MSFRQFGGLKYASKHNVVSSNLNSSNQLFVTQNVGQPNSIIDFLSDISGNITIYGNIDISGNETITGNLTVDGNETVLGNVDISGNLDISGNATAYYMFLSSGTDYSNQENAVMPKSYIDLVATGITVAGKVYAASTFNISLNVPDPSLYLDGIQIPSGQNVLLKDQNDASFNGVYNYNGTYLTRSTTILPAGSDAVGALVIVLNGNLYSKSGWIQTYKNPSTGTAIVGQDTLDFTEFYTLNFKTGNGLISTTVNNTTYISVDPSLNYMYAIDGSSNVLQLGTRTTTTGLNFGSQSHQIPIRFNGNPYTYSPYSIGSVISPPTFTIDASSNSNQIIFNWTIPGTINSSIPTSLQQLNAIVYAHINNTVNTYPILQNYNTNLLINQIIISKNSGTNGVSGTTYYYYNTDFGNLQSDSTNNILILWYSNFGPYPNVCNVGYSAFTANFPPTADAYFNQNPYSGGSTTSNNNPNSNLTLTYNTPSAIVTSGSPAGVTLASFTTDISGNGDLYTYSSVPTQNITNITIGYSGSQTFPGGNQSVTYGINNNPSTLYPGGTYYFKNLKSTNNLGETSGANQATFGPYTTQTLQVNTNLTPSTTNISNYNNNTLIATTPISGNIYKVTDINGNTPLSNVFNNQNIISNQLGPFSINYDSSTRGTLGQGLNLMNIYISIPGSNLSQTDISCNGFPTTSNPQISATNISLSPISAQDQYSATGFTGLYLKISSFTATIPSSLDASSNQYTFTFSQQYKYKDINGSLVVGATYDASQNFYYDKYNSSPSFNSLGGFAINSNSPNNNYYSSYVSGIFVLNQSPTFTVTDLSLNNMGDYFYTNPLVQYSSSGGVSISVSETNLTHVSIGSITNDSFNNTISITNPSISSTISPLYNTQISLDISLNNLNSSSYYSSIATLNVIVDVSSNLLASSLTTLYSLGSSAQPGYRIWSAPVDYEVTMSPSGIVPFVYIESGQNIPNNTRTGSTTSVSNEGYVDISYNNYWDIANNNLANEELLIAAGNFTTSNNSYYINYQDASGNGNQNTGIDYSVLTGTKFATFAWNIINITSTSYTNLNFTINFTGLIYKNNSTGFYYLDSGLNNQLLLFYRFELNSNIGNQSYWGASGGITYPNTTWISINSNTGSNNNTINTTTICNFTNKNNIYWNTSSVSSTTPPCTFTTTLPTINLNTNATLYLRIGIPNNVSNSFNNVYAYLSS